MSMTKAKSSDVGGGVEGAYTEAMHNLCLILKTTLWKSCQNLWANI